MRNGNEYHNVIYVAQRNGDVIPNDKKREEKQ
jgi:hypothetical protein